MASQSAAIPPEAPDSRWIEDGVCYVNFNQPVSLESIRLQAERGRVLRKETKLASALIPMVVYLTNGGKKTDIAVHELGKTVSFRDFMQVSAMILVGLEGATLALAELGNKLFYSNKLIFCDSLEEAKRVAAQHKNTELGIFEQGR